MNVPKTGNCFFFGRVLLGQRAYLPCLGILRAVPMMCMCVFVFLLCYGYVSSQRNFLMLFPPPLERYEQRWLFLGDLNERRRDQYGLFFLSCGQMCPIVETHARGRPIAIFKAVDMSPRSDVK